MPGPHRNHPQHRLHRCDDPARQDTWEPHGRCPPTNEKLRDRAMRIVSTWPRRRLNKPEKPSRLAGGGPSSPASSPPRDDAEQRTTCWWRAVPAPCALETIRTGRSRQQAGHPALWEPRRLGVAASSSTAGSFPVTSLSPRSGDRARPDAYRPRDAIPGLVDLQVNGYAGFDALSASVEELATLGTALAVTGSSPTSPR